MVIIRCVILLLFAMLTTNANATILFPPSPADWANLAASRHDPTPLNITQLQQQPTIGGAIIPSDWMGATSYQVLDSSNKTLGTLLFGTFNNYLYVANNWTVNTDSNPAIGGGNDWRFGTSTAQGASNSGNGNWFEVFVDNNGTTTTVQARTAANEAGLDTASFQNAADFGITASAFFNGTNWQYLLSLDPSLVTGLLPMASWPGPGPLQPSHHWEWRQLDPIPSDGVWENVYDGSIHLVPEPVSLSLLSLGLAGFGFSKFSRRKQA